MKHPVNHQLRSGCLGSFSNGGKNTPRVVMVALGTVWCACGLKKRTIRTLAICLGCWVCTLFLAASAHGGEKQTRRFTLKSSIDYALKHNPDVLISQEGVQAARLDKKGRFSEFLPKLSGRYGYLRRDDEEESFMGFVTSEEELYTLTATLDQSLFSGFSKKTQFDISKLDLEISQIREQETCQDLAYEVKKAYFGILQQQNLTMVAEQAVEQLTSQVEQAADFYEVGLIPKNDLLKSEVELANAKLDLVVARNRMAFAQTDFNILLQLPVDALVSIERIETLGTFDKTYEACVALALENRTEKKLAMLALERSEEAVQLAKKDYYPAVDLQANYIKTGDSADLEGRSGFYDDEEWNVGVTASWTFWEWGKTRYGVGEELSRRTQARLELMNVENRIRREIKEAFLNLKEARQSILTQEKAVGQAKENLRITQERYDEQVATSTEVLDAQTLLTRTQNNYFNALNVYHVSKAALHRAMGVKIE
jgi:outer membrane protein